MNNNIRDLWFNATEITATTSIIFSPFINRSSFFVYQTVNYNFIHFIWWAHTEKPEEKKWKRRKTINIEPTFTSNDVKSEREKKKMNKWRTHSWNQHTTTTIFAYHSSFKWDPYALCTRTIRTSKNEKCKIIINSIKNFFFFKLAKFPMRVY